MKITKSNLKKLIYEQVKVIVESPEWFDVYGDEYPPSDALPDDNTEASMTPNAEVDAENAVLDAVMAARDSGYSYDDIMMLIKDLEVGEEPTDVEEFEVSEGRRESWGDEFDEYDDEGNKLSKGQRQWMNSRHKEKDDRKAQSHQSKKSQKK